MNELNKKYILAMYDIRGKQKFIYGCKKIKEIVGGSLIIRDCFNDYLFPAAEKFGGKGIYFYKSEGCEKKFALDGLESRFQEGYIGEVVYEGGGNFFVLYRDRDSYINTNKVFYKKLMKEIPTLRVLTSYVEIENFENYRDDERRLRDVHRTAEREECAIHPVNSLPVVQTDYYSSLPLTDVVYLAADEGVIPEKVTRSSYAKYEKYNAFDESSDSRSKDVKILDEMVEKGIDSHLAVIYIDGNNMGAKVQRCFGENMSSYEECINALRTLSEQIQSDYIDTPIKAIDNYFGLISCDENKAGARFVINAGDEITFICNAGHAYEIVKVYFEALRANGKESNTSCAGVAIFHSHAPFTDAYRIAEECCENGKTLMKKNGILDACFLDFHYCQGAVGTSVEQIRKHEHTEEMCQPWLVAAGPEDSGEYITSNDVDNMMEVLGVLARSNSKQLFEISKSSAEDYAQELERIIAHTADETKRKLLTERKTFLVEKRTLLYRMMLVYDLWFRSKVDNGEV